MHDITDGDTSPISNLQANILKEVKEVEEKLKGGTGHLTGGNNTKKNFKAPVINSRPKYSIISNISFSVLVAKR